MTSLHDRLTDLAEAAPGGKRPPDLWEQGRRYGRRRRIEAAALTLVLLGAVGSLVGALLPQASYDVGPADARASLRLPDRLYDPSPWLRGTDEVGEIGPLVAVTRAERKTLFDSSVGVVGVSADGDYAFLDLPDLAEQVAALPDVVALSGDGQRLAYQLTGESVKEPNLLDGDVVVGLAVYDTVTGEITRHEVPTEHGISVSGLVWVGDTLWLEFGQWDQGAAADASEGSGSDYHVFRWDPSREPERIAGALANRMPAPGYDAPVVVTNTRIELFDQDGTTKQRDLRVDVDSETAPMLSPSGSRVALLEDPGDPSVNNQPQALRVGVVPPAGSDTVRTTRVGEVTVDQLWGWRDDEHVVVRDYGRNSLVTIDVETGAVEPLMTLSDRSWTPETSIAQEALEAPTFAAPEPPYVMGPRLQAALVALVLLLAGLGALVWRRRGRA
ncbi:MAG: hypothetical protein Q8O61_16000 [Nocardioides sp.]|nr:hypothetical protein [Nocardioides sp.]